MTLKSILLAVLWLLCFMPLAFSGFSTGVAVGPVGGWVVLIYCICILCAYALLQPLARSIRQDFEDRNDHFLIMICFCATAVSAAGSEPFLDDDLFRYIWDGFVNAKGLDAIFVTPSQRLEGFSDLVYNKIAYKNVASVYPPVAQLWFKLLYLLCGSSTQLWTICFALLSILTTILLLKLCTMFLVPLEYKCLLILHPVFIKEFADSCHVDVLGVFFLLVGLLTLYSNGDSKGKEHFISKWSLVTAALLIAMASMVKPLALVVALFLPRLKMRDRLEVFGLTMFFAFLILMSYFQSFEQIFSYAEHLNYFATHWVFNPFLAEVIQKLVSCIVNFDQNQFQASWHTSLYLLKILNPILIGVGLFYLLMLPSSKQAYRSLNLVGWFLISQGVVNSWYLYWIWPLVAVLPWKQNPSYCTQLVRPWLLLPLITSLASYPFWIDLEDIPWWRHLFWMGWLAFYLQNMVLLIHKQFSAGTQ